MKRRQFAAYSLRSASLLPALSALSLMSPTAYALGEIKVSLDDYCKRFLSFYSFATTAVSPPRPPASSASAPALPPLPAVLPTADERFEVYKKVNANNPRNLDDAKLRAEFDAAWPRYEKSLEVIRTGFNGLKPSPADMIGGIGGALRMEQSLSLNFICYVGTYSGQIVSGVKADKVTATDGSMQEVSRPFVAFEVESYANGGDKALALMMTDICMQAGGYIRSQQDTVANSLIAHGVYMHAARAGLQLPSVEQLLEPAGVTGAARSNDALRALRNKLQAPAGTANEKELLYAGAMVVDRWLARGLSMQEVMRTPKEQVVKVTSAVLDTILKK
jgi:hypothetical protein